MGQGEGLMIFGVGIYSTERAERERAIWSAGISPPFFLIAAGLRFISAIVAWRRPKAAGEFRGHTGRLSRFVAVCRGFTFSFSPTIVGVKGTLIPADYHS